MSRPIYIIIGVALLLLVSCGQQQQAKRVVKDFVKDELRQEADYLDFTSVDSTRVVSDSLITVMRSRASRTIRYEERKGRTLMHIRAKYLTGGDTCSATFYLTADLTGVVAFKKN